MAYSTMDALTAYLRLPLLASSGVAVLLSGLLYFKQKHVFTPVHSHPPPLADASH